MREIKFRAWDRKEKRWVYITLHPNTVSIPCAIYTESSLLTHDEHPEAFSLPNLDGWYQFTGLKDKNGKEIYEGDIVRGGPKVIAEIVFVFGCWHLLDTEMDEYRLLYPSKNGDWSHLKNGGAFDWYEIIGNIYENPEVLAA